MSKDQQLLQREGGHEGGAKARRYDLGDTSLLRFSYYPGRLWSIGVRLSPGVFCVLCVSVWISQH